MKKTKELSLGEENEPNVNFFTNVRKAIELGIIIKIDNWNGYSLDDDITKFTESMLIDFIWCIEAGVINMFRNEDYPVDFLELIILYVYENKITKYDDILIETAKMFFVDDILVDLDINVLKWCISHHIINKIVGDCVEELHNKILEDMRFDIMTMENTFIEKIMKSEVCVSVFNNFLSVKEIRWLLEHNYSLKLNKLRIEIRKTNKALIAVNKNSFLYDIALKRQYYDFSKYLITKDIIPSNLFVKTIINEGKHDLFKYLVQNYNGTKAVFAYGVYESKNKELMNWLMDVL